MQLLVEAAIGLGAGLLGGLLGIGGSVIMIPGLAILLGSRDPSTQHLYQAAAMAVNIAVSAPAAVRHYLHGVVSRQLLVLVLPTALVSIVAGVLLSNQIDGLTLRRVFALFLLYVAINTLFKTTRRIADHAETDARVTPVRAGAVGVVMGSAAGLLGIGGGILAVPAMQVLCRTPLRTCIGVSSAAMCITATIGAGLKITTLPEHGHTATEALALVAAMAPTAMLGGWFGARLTHRLPLTAVRVVLLALLLVAAWRMAAPPSGPPAAPEAPVEATSSE
jgi:uncharacterized membrane protein YfcA